MDVIQPSSFASFLKGDMSKPTLYLCILLWAIVLMQHAFQKNVRKNPSVPIVGVPHGGKLKNARKRFYSEAQSMLLEGVRKVRHLVI